MDNAELIAALRVEPFEVGSFGLARIINQAADTIEAQQKALDACAKQLADMAAKVPKEGEWIEDEYGYIHCSKCGMEWDEPEHPQTNYCPSCGARMKDHADAD